MKPTLQEFHLPTYRELPDIGLYLDQTVKYINGFLQPMGFAELTTSMVGNYVKLGLIAPPVKKQYSAEQIAYLIFIAIAKGVLSMDRIKRLLQMQHGSYEPSVAYDYFCLELKNMLYYTFGLKDTLDEFTTNHSEEKTMLRSVIAAIAQLVYFESCLKSFESE
ncbi:MAG: DUF1836 domain-containing protein [Clostridia bacterium]|nr:DUF1836 domain-containing protein [Clostridia bacterium]